MCKPLSSYFLLSLYKHSNCYHCLNKKKFPLEMDESSESNLKLFDNENKIRILVSDLVTPLIMKVAEHEVLIKDIQKTIREEKLDLSILVNDLKKLSSKVFPKDEVFSRIDSLSHSHGKKIDEISMNLSIAKLNLDKQLNTLTDLMSKVNSFSESQDFALNTIASTRDQLNNFKKSISSESSSAILMCKDFIDSQETTNISLKQKMNKISMRMSEFNSKAFPELTNLIQEKNLEIIKIKENVQELISDRVLHSHLVKLKNKLEGELSRISQKSISELEQIKSFLDTMLRVEISCGISETLLKVLDTRQIKKLIPVVESFISNDLNMTNEATSPLKNDLQPVQTENLYTKTISQTKNLESCIEEHKRRISIQEIEQKKIFELQNTRTSKAEQKVSPIKMLDLVPIKKTIVDQQDSSSIPQLVLDPQENLLMSSLSSVAHAKHTIKTENFLTNTEEGLVLPRQESRSKEYEDSLTKLSDRSNDFQSQFEMIREELKSLINVREDWEETRKGITKKLEEANNQIEAAKKEFRTHFLIFSEETGHNLKKRTKDIHENSNRVERLAKTVDNLGNDQKELESKIDSLKLILDRLIEGQKIMNELLNQDEQDRETLHLTGLTEKKETKSPTKSKQSVYLKPECLTCSGQSSLLFSAFKMACLNYYPSEVKYDQKMFSRQELIMKLQKMIQNIHNTEPISEISFMPCNTEVAVRTKSAGKVKVRRQLFDASMTKSSIHDSPKKLDLKIKKFNFS